MERKHNDESFMRAAVCEAVRGDPVKTSPNPRVGAVIVENGEIVAKGHFEKDGGPHAERHAFEALGRKPAKGAVLYVTLEPCSTKGRTGACTDAILKSGIRRVVVGASDPTPEHRGNATRVLEAAGVEVSVGVLDAECSALNPGYQGHSTAK
ncbi:bifunctional diaminohydroxyphosphoribosylaminopyrimidine deaminase/5-amino-6-(5-phosphoribosylamino)uracil reductase RibD [Pelagicoccus sp. SDUM812002]|uniref:bifunctional diaminohydroxyphosphoribosylaminopyrimidine deaminase/5-amino-6-(5-phosphoribosylamino)uracil reductase RibD n=1 Tax=Pelagicoccus sp. SDUM812002 TaxID=3041266 RepID=UPI00280FB527|nr:bifunctional diaminohydroxyphosphoribosylaminopyrimidine deaminase/5-amino-6-(5-phosphoribosylamino)uracil reductase RibD [Pelagicoccus sp. SDUM812002]MDQ8186189.1 bifunctional diaminohydroxyphosphoribosylaminopyrimidine deaminase/5-amino-6-(5-phosphoribosylamino)uracil reductase RibD [Pelagicoccus sp. SDUM812002]